MGAANNENASKTDDKFTIVVHDACWYPRPPERTTEIVDKETTISELRHKLAEKFSYKESAFDMIPLGSKVPLTEGEKKLCELAPQKMVIHLYRRAGAVDSDFGDKKKEASLLAKGTSKPSPSITSNGNSNAIVPYGPANIHDAARGDVNTSMISSMGSMGIGYSSGSDWNKKSKTGFVGLSNQGATCYMNSLIQTLYMTPEFRAALYKWNFDANYEEWKLKHKDELEKQPEEDGKKSKPKSPQEIEQERRTKREKESIPRQLQLLFSRLQLRDQRAVKTKDLTNSFGWKDSDAFTQHDVQELCRVLFDALEKVLKGTDQETMINDLYQGEMKDYVKCMECGHESSRTDKYLDIPLVIRGFGATKPVRSVEEALMKFVQPEMLVEDNQYSCEKCKKKVDAKKGLKITSFPYLLTLQLKRFDFDYESFRRIKLNDRVSFPMLLDLNPFVDTDEPKYQVSDNIKSTATTPKRLDPDVNDGKKRKLDDDIGEDDDTDDDEVRHNPMKDESDVSPMETDFDTEKQKLLQNGPYVYELYSVLIHRGSALGGHYYAYIKSFETGRWYEFNDSMVTEINENDIRKTFGDEPEPKPRGMYSFFQSSANAYMLMYRRIEPKKNLIAVNVADMPEELRKKIEAENDKYKQKLEEKEREREMVTLKVFFQGQEKQLKLHNTTTLAEATRQCGEAFDVTARYPLDCIRLRNYQVYNDLPAEPYDDPEVLQKSLDAMRFYSQKTVILETREQNEKFEEYNPSDMLLRVIRYNQDDNKFLEAQQIYVDRDATLGDLKKALQAKFRIPAANQRLVKEAWSYNGPPAKVLEGDDQSLRMDHRVFEASKIYLEYCVDFDSPSPSFAEIDRTRNMMEIKFNSPGKEEAEHKLEVSKKMTFKELKELMQPMIGLPLDEFKVSRGSVHWKFELKSDDETLDQCRLTDGARLFVEKGKPMKEGETKIEFYLFDPDLKKTKDYVEPLYEIPIDENTKIWDIKVMLANKLKEDGKGEHDPKKLRLRELFSKSPSAIYNNNATLKESATCLYNGKALAIQELQEEETEKGEDHVVPFIQQFFPDKFELGPKVEMFLNEDMPIQDFKALLSEKFGIKNVGIAKTFASWPGADLLEIPELDWDRAIPNYPGSSMKTGTISTSPLYLRDGDILFFRDNDVELKKLTADERKKLEKTSTKRRTTYHHKEEALTIHTSD